MLAAIFIMGTSMAASWLFGVYCGAAAQRSRSTSPRSESPRQSQHWWLEIEGIHHWGLDEKGLSHSVGNGPQNCDLCWPSTPGKVPGR